MGELGADHSRQVEEILLRRRCLFLMSREIGGTVRCDSPTDPTYPELERPGHCEALEAMNKSNKKHKARGSREGIPGGEWFGTPPR